ncbi:Cyclase family protein [Zea mays]|uniref:Cyclase family protein n=1 Tax=Zea mays TaxID=4577 RepID=A0A1D6GPF8_MAIZE|nr:Cyclase family protein [Zea mays]
MAKEESTLGSSALAGTDECAATALRSRISILLLLPVVAVVSGETAAHPGYAHAEEACGGVLEAEAEKATVLVPAPERRKEFDGGRIVDIIHYYREDMPEWESSEGSGEFLQLAWSMRNGSDIANFSELRLTAHSGTHVDVLGHVFEHYYDACFNVDTLELAVLNGPALLVDVPRDKNITGVDYLSVGAFDECIPAHLVFLEKRGWCEDPIIWSWASADPIDTNMS